MALVFAALATGFVFVCGANDGAALLSLALRREVPLAGVLAVLLTAIVVGPALFGLAVARTFTDRLVDARAVRGPLILLAGVAVALALVLLLTWRGVPTSLTLAVLGGLAGAGAGVGVPPVWSTLGLVLAVAAAAPLLGGLLGYLLGLAARRLPTSARLPGALRYAHVTAFAGQSLAYAANDGQKMFAVVGVALAAAHRARGMLAPSLPVLCGTALVFAAGAVLSLRRIARGATAGLLPPRPWHVVSAEVAAATAVLGSAGFGVPVSMTQSAAAGLVGAGASCGVRRVRWQFATPVMTAWLVTLPASLALGYAVGLVLREVAA
ncbi:putative low-affinity inorganic phosphate transporter [Catellatospora sp. TT07R-123]|uniref:inorganic phosphate transporter n=1 Tax=Catellatospora sp. TT07R-123 TaxID=2733863 RepID=UPI001B19505D|nr:inorganic phosphate transporter [Catellatospora sp. TT07R-123]GHJ49109.1 putative low-affinity inorganic phosphate transporter [Catellatospora sp. TT07R-123]